MSTTAFENRHPAGAPAAQGGQFAQKQNPVRSTESLVPQSAAQCDTCGVNDRAPGKWLCIECLGKVCIRCESGEREQDDLCQFCIDESCRRCHDELDGDGWDGLCGNCADAEENERYCSACGAELAQGSCPECG